jgi:predicted nucleic acid-binding protein
MASEVLFVDTWGWLVLANGRDPAFQEVSRLRAEAVAHQRGWVTTDYILDETMTRLFAIAPFQDARRFSEGIFEASGHGLLDIEHVTPERFRSAWRMRLRYHDKPRVSFTDLTSFVVMRELGLTCVLTGDAHFEQVGLGFARRP